MTTISKITGTSKPLSNIDFDAYIVPSDKQATVNIFICNQDSNNDNFYIALVPNNEILESKHYIFYNCVVLGYHTIQVTSIALNSDDKIVVKSLNGNCSFNITGMETTNGN